MSIRYTDHYNLKETPQSKPIPGKKMRKNSAGGYSFEVSDWMKLDRFLILGTEGGSYYASERDLTIKNADTVKRLVENAGIETLNRVQAISESGRAAKNSPAIFVLAMAITFGNDSTRVVAYNFIKTGKIIRIGTHLFELSQYLKDLDKGWSRGLRSAVAGWYNNHTPKQLAVQVTKYQNRVGWSHRDLLRLSHINPDPIYGLQDILQWVIKGSTSSNIQKALVDSGRNPELNPIIGLELAKEATSVQAIVKLIDTYGLQREHIPTKFLTESKVWEALLPNLGITALMRNLNKLTSTHVLTGMSESTQYVCELLTDTLTLTKGRIHPITVLSALRTYEQGHGVKGNLTWVPVPKIVDALQDAFYLAFKTIEPANKRTMLALDVSGSMGCGEVAGCPGLTPREASAAMALVTYKTEPKVETIAFTTGTNSFTTEAGGRWYGPSSVRPLSISKNETINSLTRKVSRLPFAGTDCALPMIYAKEKQIPVDTFVIYTDSETWAGKIHPVQALKKYRDAMGIDARLVVVGMVANDFTIADPKDNRSLDVVGFDSSAPAIISMFSRGEI